MLPKHSVLLYMPALSTDCSLCLEFYFLILPWWVPFLFFKVWLISPKPRHLPFPFLPPQPLFSHPGQGNLFLLMPLLHFIFSSHQVRMSFYTVHFLMCFLMYLLYQILSSLRLRALSNSHFQPQNSPQCQFHSSCVVRVFTE